MFNHHVFLIIFYLFCFTNIFCQTSEHFNLAAFSTDYIEYDLPKYNTNQWQIGDTITFTLPLNIKVSGTVRSVQLLDGIHYFIDGSVPNAGWFSAAYFEDSMNANINYQGNLQYELRPSKINKSTDPTKKTYTMRSINVNDYVVKEVDLDTAMMMKNQRSLHSNKKDKPRELVNVLNNNSTKTMRLKATVNLRVLVLYTNQAVTASGSESNLLATIVLAVGNYNKAMVNSNVDITVDYVAERMVEYDTYVEDASMSVMLSQMGSGTISTARRYIVGAHAVQLVTNNAQYCGLGNYAFGGQTNGLSVTNYGCIGGYGSLAHEVGHNIGLHHDLSVYTGSGINHGSCWDVSTSTTACKRSVMAYASCKTPTLKTNCDRVMYWSSPAISDSGNVIGDSTNMNNAQQLRDNIVTFTTRYTMSPSASPAGGSTPVTVYTPTVVPSAQPNLPSASPTDKPIFSPTSGPTFAPIPPSSTPTFQPILSPTITPTVIPTILPTKAPTSIPSSTPTVTPTCIPSLFPTRVPTTIPSQFPTVNPTVNPSSIPSCSPVYNPTLKPSEQPTLIPSTSKPSLFPSKQPSIVPSQTPIISPSFIPTPTLSLIPSFMPTTTISMLSNTIIPTVKPSLTPPTALYSPSVNPTHDPTNSPTVLSSVSQQSTNPTDMPTAGPSLIPTKKPTYLPTDNPSVIPSVVPSAVPSYSQKPSAQPSYSQAPIHYSSVPSVNPTIIPSSSPSFFPTFKPSFSKQPSYLPSITPTFYPTIIPSFKPSSSPSSTPSASPTFNPTLVPTVKPSLTPSRQPSIAPIVGPTFKPSILPSQTPTVTPTDMPTDIPTYIPTNEPTVKPTIIPSEILSISPTSNASAISPPVTIVQNSKNSVSAFTLTMMYGVIILAASCILLLCVALILRYRFHKGNLGIDKSKSNKRGSEKGSAKGMSDIYFPDSSHGGHGSGGMSNKFSQSLSTSARQSIFISPRGNPPTHATINTNTTKLSNKQIDERNSHLGRTFSRSGLLISPDQKRRSRAFTHETTSMSGTESPDKMNNHSHQYDDSERFSNVLSENDDDDDDDDGKSPNKKYVNLHDNTYLSQLSSNIDDNDDDDEAEQVDESSKFLPSSISNNNNKATHSRRQSLNNNNGDNLNHSPRIKFTQENAKLTQNISSAFKSLKGFATNLTSSSSSSSSSSKNDNMDI